MHPVLEVLNPTTVTCRPTTVPSQPTQNGNTRHQEPFLTHFRTPHQHLLWDQKGKNAHTCACGRSEGLIYSGRDYFFSRRGAFTWAHDMCSIINSGGGSSVDRGRTRIVTFGVEEMGRAITARGWVHYVAWTARRWCVLIREEVLR